MKNISSNSHDNLPLVLGVTGHRDLRDEDIPGLEAAVCRIFADLRRRCPNTPLLLLSPLAEGADRLAARVALACGAQLAAPLPMERVEYERDFGAEGSRAEFDELLGRAVNSFTMPLAPGGTAENIREPGVYRNRQYARVGIYIARHSQILIALWDGDEAKKTGGTAQVVDFMRHGLPRSHAARRLLDPPDGGPVYHILTPRASNPRPHGEPFTRRELYPPAWGSEEEARRTFAGILDRFEGFNRDARKLSGHLAGAMPASISYVMPAEQAERLPRTSRLLLERYALADAMAIHFQKKRRGALAGLFGLGAALSLFIETYDSLVFFPSMCLFLLAMLAAWLLHRFAGKRDYQNKHVDYRTLAEGLRVQFFWRLAGLRGDVADSYLRNHRGDLEWIRSAIRASNAAAEPLPAEEAGAIDAYMLVRDRWVHNQLDFYSAAAKRHERTLSRQNGYARFFLCLGIALAVLALAINILQDPHRLRTENPLEITRRIATTVLQIALAAAGILAGYAEKMAFSELVKRYARMAGLFGGALRCLTELLDKNDLAGARRLIRELGRESLVENGNWVLLHRERPMEVPVGG